MRAVLLFLLLLWPGSSQPVIAEDLVTTLSDDAIQITSNFTGEQIVVFGAVTGAVPVQGGYDVAITVRGPQQDLVVRRKERVLGVWANRSSVELQDVPTYYVMHLSPGFQRTEAEALDRYHLGLNQLGFAQAATAQASQFASAVIDLKSATGLYEEREGAVDLLSDTVFRTTFFLPSAIPTGAYEVSIYLFRQGRFVAAATETLSVAKGGMSERIAQFSDQNALAYGLACVALALSIGWFAGLIFRRP